jgi:glycerol-3-phosphate dehydrogenase
VVYYDGQFDDARLLINLVATAAEQGATLLNYAAVIGVTRDDEGFLDGVVARDVESGTEFRARAKVVINAAGPFADSVRRLADADCAPLLAPSQGIHLVLDRSFLPGESAIMVPHTSDGRVLFAIPWHGHTLVGTTDTPVEEAALEPVALEAEIDFVLRTAAAYLDRAPGRGDVLSVFAGIRPLVRAAGAKNTAALSRDHTIHIDATGLLTICGGKWTTYRHMAEDCVNQAATLARLPERACVTRELAIHGADELHSDFGDLNVYGSDAPAVQELIRDDASLGERLHRALPYCGAEVVWAARNEIARTVEDVLARRTRALFLNARAAIAMAPRAAGLMARELGLDDAWQAQQVRMFAEIARRYVLKSDFFPE